MSQVFHNLHLHSHYSNDGMITPEKLMNRLVEIGAKCFALTDHGTLSGIPDFYFAAKEKGIKFIAGNEMYLHYSNKDDGSPLVNHITIIAQNQQGFKNLVALNNVSHENTFKRRSGSIPLATMDMIHSYRQGLKIFTGCPASAMFRGDYTFGLEYVKQLCQVVGSEHVSVELMFSMADSMYVERPLAIAKELALPLVITPDSHFLRQEHAKMHPYLVKARKGFDYESATLFVYSYDDAFNFAKDHMPEAQFLATMDHMQSIIDDAEDIQIESDPVLPVSDDAWTKLYADSLVQLAADIAKHPTEDAVRTERFQREVEVITGSGFEKYFCLLYDIVRFCDASSIKYNVRGSAAGCYLLYLWNISSLDPIRYGLLFERFLNVHRSDYPDVDLDIESVRREDVLKYAWEHWGMRGVATFTTYNHKNLVHDLCRVLELPKDLELAAAEGDELCAAFKVLCDKYPMFKEMYEEVLGQIRHRGKHAGAICSIKSLDVPLERFDSEIPLIAYSESGAIKTLSKVGGVKLDALGVKKLDQLKHMERLTGQKPPLDPDDYPPEIYDTICAGHLSGMFQLGSSAGIRNLTIRIQPRRFEDIGLISALYRPGALDAFPLDDLVKFKTEPRTMHPLIDDLLKDSYSIMVYQENVMDIFALVTGTGLAGADTARRKLTPKTAKVEHDPKWMAERDKLQQEFIHKGIANGFDASLLATLWFNIDKFIRYGFNKSHAYSYAYLTIQDAWYRTFFPDEYFTALLHSEMQNTGESLQAYIFDAVKAGMTITMPHINTSEFMEFILKDKQIYLPLGVVKGLGPSALKTILEYRKAYGGFSSYEEMEKVITPKALNRTLRAKLYSLGAFAGIEGDPAAFQIDLEKANSLDIFNTLGFVVPRGAILDEIEKYRNAEFTQIGIVTDIISKNTKTGKPMKRIVLAPEGGGWYLVSDKLFSKEPDAIQKGMFVRFTVDDFNRIQTMLRYRVKLC